jgi:hypothetical protein
MSGFAQRWCQLVLVLVLHVREAWTLTIYCVDVGGGIEFIEAVHIGACICLSLLLIMLES